MEEKTEVIARVSIPGDVRTSISSGMDRITLRVTEKGAEKTFSMSCDTWGAMLAVPIDERMTEIVNALKECMKC